MTEIWFLVIVAWVALACGILSAAVADSKGRSVFGWLVVGVLTGLLGLIAIAGMPAQERVAAADGQPTEGNIVGPALTFVAVALLVFVVFVVIFGVLGTV